MDPRTALLPADADEPVGPSSTLIGPTGTAPELEVLVPPDRAVADSSPGRTHVLPLFVAGLLLVVLVAVVLVRARRARGPASGTSAQFPDGSRG